MAIRKSLAGSAAPVHVGIGGWDFAPWKTAFYPPGLAKAEWLAFASRQLTAIEINATFYRTQTRVSFQRWRDAVPDGFVFAVKGPRAATMPRDPEKVVPAIARFFASGIAALGDRLGPVLWQFPATRQFHPEEMARFLAALPREVEGLAFRHVVEARHATFSDAAFVTLLREHEVAAAVVDGPAHPLFGDLTAGFVYARLERNAEAEPEGYAGAALDGWAGRIAAWRRGVAVPDLALRAPAAAAVPRACFIFCISGDKVRAPDAARALLRRLGT